MKFSQHRSFTLSASFFSSLQVAMRTVIGHPSSRLTAGLIAVESGFPTFTFLADEALAGLSNGSNVPGLWLKWFN
jgi:hypothetical protein